MVAAYQKYLESDTLGLTNATQEIKSIIKGRGSESLQIDGHSRGTLTITNAYSSLINDGDAGKYNNLRTNMVGAAANVKNADDKLAELQGRNTGNYTEQQKSDMSIHVQGHAADPVHGVIGFNSSTGGTTKPNNVLGVIKEAGRSILGKETTAHNCYGVGNEECAIKNYWDDGMPKNGQGINKTDLPRWLPVYQPSVEINDNQGE